VVIVDKNKKINDDIDNNDKPCNCGIGLGIPIPKEIFAEAMAKMQGNQQPTVPAHYGVTDSQYDKMMKEILCDMIMNNEKSTTLDKFFSKLSAEDRVKVLAYSEAQHKLKKLCDLSSD